MNVFFDVDDTIIAWNGKLRPFVHDVFQRLIDDGHTIYIWSGVGLRWDVIDKHDLRQYVTDCFMKPVYDYRNGLRRLKIPLVPDFCVDDHSELVAALGGEAIKPYYWAEPDDREMLRIYDAISAFANRQDE